MSRYSESNLPPKGEAVKRTLSKEMFIRKGGEAWHCNGADSPDESLDCEAIHVYAEDGEYWVGMYHEGYGLYDIRFLKEDCREMSEEELKWLDASDGKKIHSVRF